MGMSISWITDSVVGQAPVVDPDAPAVALDDESPLTWTELHAAEIRYASALQRAGVRKGDRVGMLLKNSVDYFVFFLAIARAGGIGVRLNWRLAPAELKFILKDSGATVLVFDEDLQDRIAGVRSDLEVTTYVVRPSEGAGPSWATPLPDFLKGDAHQDFPVLDLGDPVSLLYTSGTTGLPKGAIWTHANTLLFGSMQGLRWKFDSSTVAMTAGPLFHVGGLEAVLGAALSNHGTAVTFSSGSFDLRRYFEVSRHQQVTTMLLYSFMAPDFLRIPDCEDLVPASLTRIICGGDTLMPWVYGEFERRFPQIELVQVYGLTEGGAVSSCLDGKFSSRAGSIGRAMPLAEMKVVRRDNSLASADEVGEILVRSPAVSPGYWKRPEATAETFVDGWCRTGDLGSVDADGFFTLGGRSKDMIRSGGENIYPAEIEAVLATATGVADAAVFAVPDVTWGEVGCAVMVPMKGAEIDVALVRAHCVAHLAKYKVPKHFLIASDLPRTPSGKVKKFELRDQYGGVGQEQTA